MGVRAARGADGGAAAALGAAALRLFGLPRSAAAARRRAGSPGGLWNVIRKLLAGGAASGGRFSTRGRAN